ncbi:MAG: hypothetical protein ACUVTD_06350 [Nitrososphaerales archaeon]
MAFEPEGTGLISHISTVHTHINLIGLVLFMIAGVGYHLSPVFSGTKLYSMRLGVIHFYLSNIALSGFLMSMLMEEIFLQENI